LLPADEDAEYLEEYLLKVKKRAKKQVKKSHIIFKSPYDIKNKILVL